MAGFGLTLGIHIAIGYTDLLHLAPAILGPAALFTGLILWTREDKQRHRLEAQVHADHQISGENEHVGQLAHSGIPERALLVKT
jgi:hypothetical protein